jgi:putative flippase GtrA
MSGLLQDAVERAQFRAPTARWASHTRKLHFALVGAVCFGFQYTLLRALSSVGVPRPVANGAGFVLSSQVNFMFSTVVTWRDRWEGPSRQRPVTNRRRWLSYNATAATALVVNTIVFTLAYGFVGTLPAALSGVGAGAVVTYLICDRLIFGDATTAAAASRTPLLEGRS